MKKYRCPICKTEFVGKLEHCPKCGIELHYIDEEVKKEVKVPVATFHYDDFDILNKGIQEEENDEVEEVAKEKKGSYSPAYLDRADNGARIDAFGNYLSYFDGTPFGEFWAKLRAALLCIVTAFIFLPSAMCIYYRWEAKHTVINGRRLCFDGKGMQLFGRYLLWLLLTIVTLGIFSIFLSQRLHAWKISHTKFKSVKIEEEKN